MHLYLKASNQTSFAISNVWIAFSQSYEIKLLPRAILGFKILEIFPVEN
jgi:predicted MFS family arabinose efflux permease